MSAVIKMNPFSLLDPNVDVAFDDLVRRTFGSMPASDWVPPADIQRDGDDVAITLEIPGVAPGNLDVEVRDRVLLVKGRRSNPLPEGSQIIRREIRAGDFSRTFRIPAHVTGEHVSASYTDGLLHIRISGASPEPKISRVPVKGLSEPASQTAITDSETSE